MRPVERYRAWAVRVPFVLEVDTDSSLEIAWPDADTLLAYDPQAPLMSRLVLLAGEAATDLFALLAHEDILVMRFIVDDLAEYFGCTQARRVVALLDRYYDAIASDLHDIYSLDVGAVFRGECVPDELAARIEGLARHSRFSEAMTQDEDLARVPRAPGDAAAPAVRHTEWTPETERLTKIIERLGELIVTISSIAGGRANIRPEPRPVSAASRLQAQREHDEYLELLDDFEQAQARWKAAQSTTPEED
jgi:hypothetical protein